MSRTRIVFFVIVALAVITVVGALIWQSVSSPADDMLALPDAPDTLEVRVVCSLPVEPWVQEAARQFNAGKRELEGIPIKVTIIPMDGWTAKGRLERGEMDPLPMAWIPENRHLVDLVNVTYKERLGRDVFLTDGEYRARPIAVSLLAWGIYESRAKVLETAYGEITWQAIHDAAMLPGGWKEIGGEDDWLFFKLAISNPRKNISGLEAIIAAAGEYFDTTAIGADQVGSADFQAWMKEILSSMSDLSGGAYTVSDLALFGYSTGDAGQLLESDLLTNMAGIQTRWADPLRIYYPKYVTWFDFPFTVWMGPETSALEKNAALEFEKFLLSEQMQQDALVRGLRPVNPDVPLDATGSLFVQWQDQGVMLVVPRTTRMRSPDRDTLVGLLQWFDRNIAGR
ncbi:MAG: substrate-binding domain-containing protein [Anaerolineae bacterium]|nr:MAG: substrate-binding domain-containing protein [Anaerolineae bacterium]